MFANPVLSCVAYHLAPERGDSDRGRQLGLKTSSDHPGESEACLSLLEVVSEHRMPASVAKKRGAFPTRGPSYCLGGQ
jgi:hypothetical protein